MRRGWESRLARAMHLIKAHFENAWGSCFSGVWGLVSFCRPKFDFLCVRLSPPRCLTCSLDLQGVQWPVGNSCDTRKLPRTPHANKKKKHILKRKRIQTHQYSVVTFWALVITWPDVCMIRSWAMIRYSQASLDLFKGLKTNNHIYIYIYIYKHINTCKSCVKFTLSYF